MLKLTIKYLNTNPFLNIMANNVLMESKLVRCAYDQFLATLCNKTRLAIIQSLREESKNVTELTADLAIHQTSVSHALKRLLDCGFVFVRQKGKERVYTVNQKTIKPLVDLMQNHINKYCVGSCCKGKKERRKKKNGQAGK